MMIEYGYMEDGYLRSRILEEQLHRYTNNDGEQVTRTITIEEQVSMLSDIWKPVDLIDDSKLECEEGYVIQLIPYDAGDRIAYEYKKIVDVQKIKTDIEDLKNLLTAGDYKITKCYEATLLGKELPYDINELHQDRESLRKRINQLEAYQNELDETK